MNKKGISVVSLSVTIVVLLVILSTISVSITYSVANAKKLTFAKEIYNIQSIVTEYIQKENVLPSTTSTIQIEPSDLEQFDGEKITDGKLLLNILDLTELDIVNTKYGNNKLGETNEEVEKDIYAVSIETGKVYYIAGFKDKDKTYYTLTDELLNMIEKRQELLINEKSIVFMPSKIGWTNEGVKVIVFIPKEYESPSITVDNNNISYTSKDTDEGIYYYVNEELIIENYSITISYIKNSVSGSARYSTRIDTTAPEIMKDTDMSDTDIYLRGYKAVDLESGVKYFKYTDEAIDEKDVKGYMKYYGKNIKKNRLRKITEGAYTIYAEDRAGNYSIMYLDMNYPKVSLSTTPIDVSLNNKINLTNATSKTLTFNAIGTTKSKIATIKEVVFEIKNGNDIEVYKLEADSNGMASMSYKFGFGLSYVKVYVVDTLERLSEPLQYDFKIETATMTGTKNGTALDFTLTPPKGAYISSYSYTVTNELWLFIDIYLGNTIINSERKIELYGKSHTHAGNLSLSNNSIRYVATTSDSTTNIKCEYKIVYKSKD